MLHKHGGRLNQLSDSDHNKISLSKIQNQGQT